MADLLRREIVTLTKKILASVAVIFLALLPVVVVIGLFWNEQSLLRLVIGKVCELSVQNVCGTSLTLSGSTICPFCFFSCSNTCHGFYLTIIAIALLIFVFAIIKLLLDFIFILWDGKK